MFGPDLVAAFLEIKSVFDPGNRMNPGKVVAPNPLDQELRLGSDWTPQTLSTAFAYPDDDGRFDRAVTRCVGIGNCRHDHGGVMCPSYRVTREEEHSTRGRARLLFEMLSGHDDSPVSGGWRSTEVRDALDLCLSCKGCKKDCPVGVDMATYKAEFLHHHYARRLRPRSHYSMGWLPLAAQAAARMPRTVNALTSAPGVNRLIKAAGGVDRRREIPLFAEQTLQAWFSTPTARDTGTGERGPVVLWPDTFTNHLNPAIGKAAVDVLTHAGYQVVMPSEPVCCGLTWISTGQLDTATKVLRRTLRILEPHLRAGTPIVGLEPSCTAVFRNDARDLLPGDRDAARLTAQTVTLAELLHRHTPGWEPPQLARHAIAQTHCHQHAVMGFDADTELLRGMGLDVDVLDVGCCGLAGNFGFEKGHYDISRAVGEQGLLPAVRHAAADVLVMADGFSCRTQIEQGDTGRTPVHLAEVLAAATHHNQPEPERPTPPHLSARRRVAAAVVGAVGALAAAVAIGRRR